MNDVILAGFFVVLGACFGALITQRYYEGWWMPSTLGGSPIAISLTGNTSQIFNQITRS